MSKLKMVFKSIFQDPAVKEQAHSLQDVFLFKEVSGRALSLLAREMMEKSYGEGEIIFQEGDVGRALFIVLKGKIELVRSNATGGEDLVAVLGAGDFFGEMVLLDELPRSATARVLEPARLAILYKAKFDTLLLEVPSVASKILHALARLLSARLRRDARQSTDKSKALGML